MLTKSGDPATKRGQRRAEEYFVFADPTTGRYCAFPDGPIAVFRTEETARREEEKSPLLKKMVGHWATKEEIECVAKRRTMGRWRVAD